MTSTKICPLPVGNVTIHPTNHDALVVARRLMAKYPDTTFGVTKRNGHWVVVRYA